MLPPSARIPFHRYQERANLAHSSLLSFRSSPTPPGVTLAYATVNPSDRRHALWASMSFWQMGSSSPLNTTHSSRAVLVSGQQQQIFFPLLIPTFCSFAAAGAAAGVGADAEFPIVDVCVRVCLRVLR